MHEVVDDWPFGPVFAGLFVIAMLRGQLLYWIGRVVTQAALDHTHPTKGWRARTHRWLTGGGADAGIDTIRSWGLVMVPLSYLTIGFQSVVQAGAGVLRIPAWRYAAAQVPGALAWGAIYTTFGFVTWAAIGSAVGRSPLAAALLGLLGLAVVAMVVRRRRTSS